MWMWMWMWDFLFFLFFKDKECQLIVVLVLSWKDIWPLFPYTVFGTTWFCVNSRINHCDILTSLDCANGRINIGCCWYVQNVCANHLFRLQINWNTWWFREACFMLFTAVAIDATGYYIYLLFLLLIWFPLLHYWKPKIWAFFFPLACIMVEWSQMRSSIVVCFLSVEW